MITFFLEKIYQLMRNSRLYSLRVSNLDPTFRNSYFPCNKSKEKAGDPNCQAFLKTGDFRAIFGVTLKKKIHLEYFKLY